MYKYNLYISSANILLLIGFLLAIPNLDYFQAVLRGIILISIPWLIFLLLDRLYKKKFKRVLFITNTIVLAFIILVFYAFYQGFQSKKNMYFDKYNSHEFQENAEKSVKDYINENAMFPESYEPLEFGNLKANEVSKLANKNIKNSDIIEGIERTGSDYLDTLKLESDFIKFENYNFRHSYFLKNRDGRRLFRIAFIQLDSNLKVTSLFNQEDFTTISWKDYFGKEKN